MHFFKLLAVVAANAVALSAQSIVERREGRLEARAQANPVVGLKDGINGRAAPARQNILNLQKNNPDQFNLYILGLDALMSDKYSNQLSWFSIAGIHGRPYQGWNGEKATGNAQSGYCTHSSILFPTWHRPYLALYEQTLSAKIQMIVKQFPANQRARWQKAALGFRIPYWDWATNAQMPSVVGTQQTITVTKPTGRTTINNPLYSYKFRQGVTREMFPWYPYYQWRDTKRNANSNYPASVSQPNVVNAALANQAYSLQQQAYHLLVDPVYKTYKTMSNMATGSDAAGNSIEGMHNTIHAVVGGNGHMTLFDYSAFDPIFFLHHTNIDRIFAIWQALNPVSYVTSQTNSAGTYGIPAGSVETIETPLTPFRAANGKLHTSRSVRSIASFGYSYPELGYWRYKDTPSFQAAVRKSVNQLYGSTNAQFSAAAASTRKRGLISDIVDSVANIADQTVDAAETIVNKTITALADSVIDNVYHDWKVNVQVDSMAVAGAYKVHVFLGKPSDDPGCWALQPELVGDYSVLSNPDASSYMAGHLIAGSVPLTQALSDDVAAGKLKSLNPEDAVPYLTKNLQWRVSSGMNSTVYCVDDIKDFQLGAFAAKVTLPKFNILEEFPVFGSYEFYPSISCEKAGGAKTKF